MAFNEKKHQIERLTAQRDGWKSEAGYARTLAEDNAREANQAVSALAGARQSLGNIIRQSMERLNAQEKKIKDRDDQIDGLVGELERMEEQNEELREDRERAETAGLMFKGQREEVIDELSVSNATIATLSKVVDTYEGMLEEAARERDSLLKRLEGPKKQGGQEVKPFFEGWVPIDSPVGQAISKMLGIPDPPPMGDDDAPFPDMTDEPAQDGDIEYPVCPNCHRRHPQQG